MRFSNLISKIPGFSLIELEVTLVILAIGLFGFAGLFKVYSQQISYIEQNCEPNMYLANPGALGAKKDYWIVSQANKWMRQFGAPAQIDETEGIAWQPSPVDGNKIGICTVTTTSDISKNYSLNKAVINIRVVKN